MKYSTIVATSVERSEEHPTAVGDIVKLLIVIIIYPNFTKYLPVSLRIMGLK